MSSSVCQFLMMHLWLLFTLTALTECISQQTDVHPCPHLCSCSLLHPTLGVEVSCSHFSFSESFPPNTTKLSFQSTPIGSITAAHLSVVPHLKKLQLYHTNLTILPSNLLSCSPQMQTLDLTGNRLVNLPPNIFNHSSLRDLVIKDNLLEEVDPDWFPTDSSITWLDLSGNNLTKVSAVLFQRLKNLRNLDLNDNNLQVLHPETFKNLHHLESLNLAGNKFISLHADTFSSNRKLTHVFLQENHLQELPATIFHSLEHLQLLLINNNRLQSLPTGLFDGKDSNLQIMLIGNPWKCDGEITYLLKWLNSHPGIIFFLEEVTCDSPETLKHKPVVELNASQLALEATT